MAEALAYASITMYMVSRPKSKAAPSSGIKAKYERITSKLEVAGNKVISKAKKMVGGKKREEKLTEENSQLQTEVERLRAEQTWTNVQLGDIRQQARATLETERVTSQQLAQANLQLEEELSASVEVSNVLEKELDVAGEKVTEVTRAVIDWKYRFGLKSIESDCIFSQLEDMDAALQSANAAVHYAAKEQEVALEDAKKKTETALESAKRKRDADIPSLNFTALDEILASLLLTTASTGTAPPIQEDGVDNSMGVQELEKLRYKNQAAQEMANSENTFLSSLNSIQAEEGDMRKNLLKKNLEAKKASQIENGTADANTPDDKLDEVGNTTNKLLVDIVDFGNCAPKPHKDPLEYAESEDSSDMPFDDDSSATQSESSSNTDSDEGKEDGDEESDSKPDAVGSTRHVTASRKYLVPKLRKVELEE